MRALLTSIIMSSNCVIRPSLILCVVKIHLKLWCSSENMRNRVLCISRPPTYLSSLSMHDYYHWAVVLEQDLRIEKESLVNGMGWKCTLLPHFRLAFWHAFIGNANRMRTVFRFCYVLESCKHQVGKIECLYLGQVQQKTPQAFKIQHS